jgi:hypothetical protein
LSRRSSFPTPRRSWMRSNRRRHLALIESRRGRIPLHCFISEAMKRCERAEFGGRRDIAGSPAGSLHPVRFST